MTRGLHPHTLPQRLCGEDGEWAAPSEHGPRVEYADVSPRRAGKALAWSFVGLGASMAAIGLLLGQIRGHAPISPAEAEARFRSPAPPLLANPAQALRIEREVHAAPDPVALAASAREIERQGWDREAPQPGPAQTALERAGSSK